MESAVKLAVPTLIARSRGGWLAVSKPECPLKIGVSAETEEKALAAFDRAVAEWEALTRDQPEH
jgi:hypothetical protein